ncbi:DUF1353 domain-containing protein [Pseudomonas sp. DTU_2021_1001937_2_SI_NGA_ILE_001]|uniref:DUF1353 domain-containing protein n=1 Tax=Pseudomonas sp. DTU_2021_1001937_2_SI_NGA_ILE_001 TaxID=3077589 RepID=UPI0028FC282C|nr:DUF1353 domain-containing protein [Pseudomonas sp. DTU_2021_1001937_2_SI_NGA_ILE_001]WNW11238.1 DUF1353 domain-containing protein [Pseudomonas sp. DTU_2021_1001937_2_SI_NGA_ILE_001]
MSDRFLDPLVLQAYAKGEWVLMSDFRYQAADGTIYTAPKYFITDLASTPWIVKPLLSGIEDRACGVIHDLLYCDNRLPRVVCDALFYEMLLVAGADKKRAGLMHLGLRVGGGPRYAACAGGIKVEDLAFELMSEVERVAWRGKLQPALVMARD